MQKQANDFPVPPDSPTRLVASFPEDSKKYFHSGKLNFVIGHPWDSWQESPMPVVAVQLCHRLAPPTHAVVI